MENNTKFVLGRKIQLNLNVGWKVISISSIGGYFGQNIKNALELGFNKLYNIISESENNMNLQELIFNMLTFVVIAAAVRLLSKLIGA